jgi:LysM repeat protein
VAVVVVVAVLGGVAAARAAGPDHPQMARVSHTTYVVEPGDTLWGIATRVAPGTDPGPVIDGIERANGIDAGSIVPGQQLVIPAS